jgi:hypothetical protein
MKLLFVIYSGPSPESVTALLEANGAPGYTILDDVTGAGPSGKLAGTRAFPGTATILLSVLPADHLDPVRTALRAHQGRLAPGEHLHVATVPIEDYF